MPLSTRRLACWLATPLASQPRVNPGLTSAFVPGEGQASRISLRLRPSRRSVLPERCHLRGEPPSLQHQRPRGPGSRASPGARTAMPQHRTWAVPAPCGSPDGKLGRSLRRHPAWCVLLATSHRSGSRPVTSLGLRLLGGDFLDRSARARAWGHLSPWSRAREGGPLRQFPPLCWADPAAPRTRRPSRTQARPPRAAGSTPPLTGRARAERGIAS